MGEFPKASHEIGSDPEQQVVIMIGTEDTFFGPRAMPEVHLHCKPCDWDTPSWEDKHLLLNVPDIEVPKISAVNGTAWRHSE